VAASSRSTRCLWRAAREARADSRPHLRFGTHDPRTQGRGRTEHLYIDVIFPAWIPFSRFGLADDIPANFAQVKRLDSLAWEKLVTGHVGRTGTHADVQAQDAFDEDIKAAAAKAFGSTQFLSGINPADTGNQWALFDNWFDRTAVACVNNMGDKWKSRLAGYDAFIWDDCYAISAR
jgi:hypothetical protein